MNFVYLLAYSPHYLVLIFINYTPINIHQFHTILKNMEHEINFDKKVACSWLTSHADRACILSMFKWWVHEIDLVICNMSARSSIQRGLFANKLGLHFRRKHVFIAKGQKDDRSTLITMFVLLSVLKRTHSHELWTLDVAYPTYSDTICQYILLGFTLIDI